MSAQLAEAVTTVGCSLPRHRSRADRESGCRPSV